MVSIFLSADCFLLEHALQLTCEIALLILFQSHKTHTLSLLCLTLFIFLLLLVGAQSKLSLSSVSRLPPLAI